MSLLSRLFGKKPQVSEPETPEKQLVHVVGKIGYEIIVKDGQRAIKCLRCEMTSWSQGDVDHLYCANCKMFHQRRKF